MNTGDSNRFPGYQRITSLLWLSLQAFRGFPVLVAAFFRRRW